MDKSCKPRAEKRAHPRPQDGRRSLPDGSFTARMRVVYGALHDPVSRCGGSFTARMRVVYGALHDPVSRCGGSFTARIRGPVCALRLTAMRTAAFTARSGWLVLLLAVSLTLVGGRAGARQQAASPDSPSEQAALVERIALYSEPFGLDARSRDQFLALNPEAKYNVISGLWRRDLPDAARANLLSLLSEWRGGVSQIERNPRLLNEIALGMNDEGPLTQQQAATLLYSLTLRTFADPDEFAAWRGRNAGKPLERIVAEGAAAFAANFKKSEPARQITLLQSAGQTQFLDSFSVEVVDGKSVETVAASGLTGVRRRAVIDAGLLDSVAALGHLDSAEAALTAANFLRTFHAGASYRDALESDVRRAYTKLLANPATEGARYNLPLLLTYRGAWADETLTQIVAQTYAGKSGDDALAPLYETGDSRAIPLLIALADSVGAERRRQILTHTSELAKVPFDLLHDTAWWRCWWRENRSKLPPETQAIPLLDLKKTPEIVALRLTRARSAGGLAGHLPL